MSYLEGFGLLGPVTGASSTLLPAVAAGVLAPVAAARAAAASVDVTGEAVGLGGPPVYRAWLGRSDLL